MMRAGDIELVFGRIGRWKLIVALQSLAVTSTVGVGRIGRLVDGFVGIIESVDPRFDKTDIDTLEYVQVVSKWGSGQLIRHNGYNCFYSQLCDSSFSHVEIYRPRTNSSYYSSTYNNTFNRTYNTNLNNDSLLDDYQLY